jgi:hypothetical protein
MHAFVGLVCHTVRNWFVKRESLMRAAGAPFLVVAFSFLGATGARAGIALADPPVPQRAALADSIVIGKVVEVEEEPVGAFPLLKVPGGPRVLFRVARVQVENTLFGPAGGERVRVAVGPGRKPLILKVGQTGCFFLRKHPEESFHVLPASWDLIERGKAERYDEEVALARRCGRLLGDTDAGLRSRDGEDRLLTAAMLIFRFRTVRWAYRGAAQTRPIDAGLSRRILAILAEGPLDGEAARKPLGRVTLFFRLGLTKADGWTPPADLKEIPAAVERWLGDSAARYRIRQYVPEE